MYNKKKNQEIIDRLISGTESGHIKWKLRNSIFNDDTTYKMEYISDDSLTSFQIKVELTYDLNDIRRDSSTLYLKNKKLVDGELFLYSSEYNNLIILKDLIFQKFIKKSIITNNKIRTYNDNDLDDILGSISKQSIRNEKINELLEKKETEELLEKRVKKIKQLKLDNSKETSNKKPWFKFW